MNFRNLKAMFAKKQASREPVIYRTKLYGEFKAKVPLVGELGAGAEIEKIRLQNLKDSKIELK